MKYITFFLLVFLFLLNRRQRIEYQYLLERYENAENDDDDNEGEEVNDAKDSLTDIFDKSGINLPFNKAKNEALIQYFDNIVSVAKSQLKQPERGEKGETGEKGNIGDSGGIYVRYGRITRMRTGRKKSKRSSKSLDIGNIGKDDANAVMGGILTDTNDDTSQMWELLSDGQLKNHKSNKCLIAHPYKMEDCINIVTDDSNNNSVKKRGDEDDIAIDKRIIPVNYKWIYNEKGQLVNQQTGTINNQRECLEAVGKKKTMMKPCRDKEEKQRWWFG